MEELYDKNFKSLRKEFEEDTRNWKDLPCSQAGRIDTVKATVLPKAIQRFNAMPIKIQEKFFTDLEKSCTTLYGKVKNPGYTKQSCTIKKLLEASQSLSSNSTTELQ